MNDRDVLQNRRFPLPQRIDMSHGAGGKATHALIEGLFLPAFANPQLNDLSDAAVFSMEKGKVALTTDAFVVQPLVFPGGSIGRLAVFGTVNDLSVSGAFPTGLAVSLIIEEGLATERLAAEVEAMAQAAKEAGVPIVTGDTKVVQHGHGDGMYVVTTGFGMVQPEFQLSASSVQPGDAVICSGTIGDHGIAILIARGELELEGEIRSDSAPLLPLIRALKEESLAQAVRWMRDPTRGGVGTTLNELAKAIQWNIVLDEETIPLREEVAGACEILGLDPLYIANEGKMLLVVRPQDAERVVETLRRFPQGERASVIGHIAQEREGLVLMRTAMGGTRVVDMLVGDPLPRIC